MARHVCTFAVAHTNISAQPFSNAGRTVRILIPNNLAGQALYAKFSNYYSKRPVWIEHATIALADEAGNLLTESIQTLTVGGDTSFAIVPDRDVFSDRIAFEVQPGQTIAVSLYYPVSEKPTSGNFVGTFAVRSTRGDYAAEVKMPKARILSTLSKSVLTWDMTNAVTTLSALIVEQDEALIAAPNVIAAFGDSIMQQDAWVTPFAQRLYKKFPGKAAVCNLGIGGNRLLHDSPASVKGIYGPAGVERFAQDVLSLEGLTHVIFGLGTNDLGLPGKDGTPLDELITVSQYQNAVTEMVRYLNKRGVKAYGALMLPRELNGVYTPMRESLRRTLNDWIQNSGVFDAVLDFVSPVADPSGVGMKKEFALPDGLHPNRAGGLALAQSIDLSLFE